MSGVAGDRVGIGGRGGVLFYEMAFFSPQLAVLVSDLVVRVRHQHKYDSCPAT